MSRLPIILTACIISTAAFAVDLTQYVKDPTSKGSDVSQYSSLQNTNEKTANFDSMSKQYTGGNRDFLRKYYKKIGVSDADMDAYFKTIENGGAPTSYSTTIFFLTSKTVPLSNTKNFMIGFDRLKKKNPSLQGYLVMNGFMKGNGGFKGYLDSLDISSSNVIGKIHPFLFERLNVKKVPAFVISECPDTVFKEEYCDHKIIAYGAMSLEGFLSLVQDKSKEEKYKKLYYDLISPN